MNFARIDSIIVLLCLTGLVCIGTTGEADQTETPAGEAVADRAALADPQPGRPGSLSYSVDVASTRVVTHTAAVTQALDASFTAIADVNYLYQLEEAPTYSGEAGFQARLSEPLSLKMMVTSSQTGKARPILGGNFTLESSLNGLWSGERSTRLQLGAGVSQLWAGPGTDPFGLDQRVYQLSVSGGLVREIVPDLELSLLYSHYGLTSAQPARENICLGMRSPLSPVLALQLSLSELYQQGQDWSATFGLGFTYTAPSQHWSVGTHGGLFQQAVKVDPGLHAAPASVEVSRSSALPSSPVESLGAFGYSVGLDLGIAW